jgi:hypothetical protein
MPLLLNGGEKRIHIDVQNSPHADPLTKKPAGDCSSRVPRRSRIVDWTKHYTPPKNAALI